MTRFKTGNVFTERHTNTIGVDFSMKTLNIDDKKIKLQIWVKNVTHRWNFFNKGKYFNRIQRGAKGFDR